MCARISTLPHVLTCLDEVKADEGQPPAVLRDIIAVAAVDLVKHIGVGQPSGEELHLLG